MDIDWKERVLCCERAGLSRADIADFCGLSYSSLGDLMRGATREPRGMAAVKLWQLSERLAAGLEEAA
ncbi:hypothetical protein C3942_07570 [Solimonas fluminis]|uniref:Uncharacterized protein n=1 Tax=Solimonas fluminis TaxID=2086571 RepID=A0A2S5TI22_9GAMM|nr:helix-turn-helix domain-containing protein [Solimonas fluminis]PPE74612.1 hypothetical protein C3942_07570 [Solimonas fluminis]